MPATQKVSRFELSIVVPIRIWAAEGAISQLDDLAQQIVEVGAKEGAVWEKVPAQRPSDIGSDDWRDRHDYQAQAYFHPFVRRFLYGAGRVQRLQRADLRKVSMTPEARDARAIEFVPCCTLWLFATRIAMLQLALKARIRPDEPLALADVQLVLDQLRRLYPPYFDASSIGGVLAGHCPARVAFEFSGGRSVVSDFEASDRFVAEARRWLGLTDERMHSFCWASHWQELLKPFATSPESDAKELHALQLGDDRACVLSFVAFESSSALVTVDRGNWMRLGFADAPGNDELPYQRQFLEDFEQRHCYDRFWYRSCESTDSPSRLINCGYAFTWAGSADDRFFFMNERAGAIVTFRHLYVPMGIVAQFHRAALLGIKAELASLVPPRDSSREAEQQSYREHLNQTYRRFIDFTRMFWFDEVSPQLQAREMFEQWRKQLRTQALFDEVRQELRDLTELHNANAQAEQAREATALTREATLLTRVALPFAALSVAVGAASMLVGLLGVNTLDFDPTRLDRLCWIGASQCDVSPGLTVSMVAAVLALLLALLTLAALFFSRIRERLAIMLDKRSAPASRP